MKGRVMYHMPLSDDGWYLLPDPEDRGREDGWMHDRPDDAVMVSVPSCIEETFPGTDGVVWYWRLFHASDLPDQHHFQLRFDGVDYFAEVWLNDHYLGGCESGLLPFGFDVTNSLREGENRLAVRVIDPTFDAPIDGFQLGNVPGGRQHEDPWTPGHYHYNYGGILEDVTLEGRRFQWIDDAFIQPNVADSSVDVQIELGDRKGVEENLTIEATVAPDYPDVGEPIARVRRSVRVGKGRQDVHVTMYLPKVVLWRIHDAFLYRLNLTLLRGDEVLDAWSGRFGMREFSFTGGHLAVNGEPILLRGFLYNQIWPVTLGRPFGQMASRDIELARDAGANLMRAFSKTPCRATLDACDEKGMLVQVESLAAWHLSEGPVAARARRLEDLMIRQVRRDRNRACVLWWCCLNETTGDLLTYTTEQILPRLRTLDPTRIILNADNATPEGCVQWVPEEPVPRQHFQQWHWYIFENVSPAEPVGYSVSGSMLDRIRAIRGRELLGKPDRDAMPFYLSEWGAPHGSEWAELLELYAAYRPDLEDAALFRELVEHHRQQYALLRLEERGFPTFDAFLTAGKRAVAKRYEEYLTTLWGNPKAVGHCLVSFEDSGYEISGVVDIWRRPKVGTFQRIREMNSRCFLNVDWQPRSLYVGDPVNVDVTLVNERVIDPGRYVLSLTFQGPDQTTLWHVHDDVDVTGDLIQPLFAYSLKGAAMGGPHRLTVVLREESAPAGRGTAVHVRTLSVFERVPPRHLDVTPPRVWDEGRALGALLDAVGVPYEEVRGPEDVRGNAPIFVTKSHIGAEDRAIWQAIVERWEAGVPVGVLDHRLFAEGSDLTAHLPDMDGWKPNPRLLAWDYGGLRFVTNHELFAGLPHGCSIGSTDIYARLCPVDSWQVHTRPASVECDIAGFHANIERRDPYTADLCVLTHKGRRLLLTTLNLVANLGKDPASDRLVLNMLQFFST